MSKYVIQWDTGRIIFNLAALYKMKKSDFNAFMKFAHSCGGWKVVQD